MKHPSSEQTRGPGLRSRARSGGGLWLRAALGTGLGLAVVLGGSTTAASAAADCGPSTVGTIYPPTVCAALTSSNAVGAGGRLSVSGDGFKPITSVSVVLHSSVINLSTLTSDSSGTVNGNVTIPDSVPAGAHDLDLTGVNPDGSARLLTATVQIEAQSRTGSGSGSGFGALFWTGMGVAALVVLGVLLLLITRNRRGGQAG
jgi:hypothetical protein